jgi:hypothetical protein
MGKDSKSSSESSICSQVNRKDVRTRIREQTLAELGINIRKIARNQWRLIQGHHLPFQAKVSHCHTRIQQKMDEPAPSRVRLHVSRNGKVLLLHKRHHCTDKVQSTTSKLSESSWNLQWQRPVTTARKTVNEAVCKLANARGTCSHKAFHAARGQHQCLKLATTRSGHTGGTEPGIATTPPSSEQRLNMSETCHQQAVL